MNDLLGGAQAGGKRGAKYQPDDEGAEEQHGDIEEGGPPPPPPTDEEQSMKLFFKSVEALKTDMAEIRGLQREVTDLNEKGKTIVKTKEVQKHQEEMQVGAGRHLCAHRNISKKHITPKWKLHAHAWQADAWGRAGLSIIMPLICDQVQGKALGTSTR